MRVRRSMRAREMKSPMPPLTHSARQPLKPFHNFLFLFLSELGYIQNMCVRTGMHSLDTSVVYLCESVCMCAWKPLCVCVCHRLKVGSEGVSQRWEDREAH